MDEDEKEKVLSIKEKVLSIEDVKAALTDSMEAVKGMVRQEITPFAESVKKIDERLTKIEALPVSKVRLPAIISRDIYSGRRLDLQGEELRDKIKTCKYPLRALRTMDGQINEDEYTRFKKIVLDLSLAVLPVNKVAGAGDAQMRLKELITKTDLTIATNATVGYLVPDEYLWDMVQLAREKTWALNECTIVNMSQNDLYLPAELTLVSTSWKDEAAQMTGVNPTVSQVHLQAKKLTGMTTNISIETIQDSAIDIVGMLTDQFGYAIDLELDNQVLNGTGSPVSGVLTAAAGFSVVMANTGSGAFSSIAADQLRNMIRKLSSVDSVNGKFVYSKDVQYWIDTLKDTYGQYIYRQPASDRPAALWSRPIIEASNAPLEAATGAGTGFVAFGDWKKFYIGRRLGPTSLEADPYYKFDYNQIRYRLISRWALTYGRASALCRLMTGS